MRVGDQQSHVHSSASHPSFNSTWWLRRLGEVGKCPLPMMRVRVVNAHNDDLVIMVRQSDRVREVAVHAGVIDLGQYRQHKDRRIYGCAYCAKGR